MDETTPVENTNIYPSYMPDDEEQKAIREVLMTYERGRQMHQRQYNYFGGRNLYDVIDDWTKRWNGYIPPLNPLMDSTSSNIFINFTRNAIISYLAKVALTPVKSHIQPVNKKTGLVDQKAADIFESLNKFSLDAENGDEKFLQVGLECAVKGTVVVYEGYLKDEQEMKSPIEYDSETGKVTWKKTKRILYDNCYQQIVPLEDFYITNPFEPKVQRQPKILWRRLTTISEGEREFSHFSNWKYVRPGAFVTNYLSQTYYRDELTNYMQPDQIEILRYYCKYKNRHIILVNGVVLYDGPIPFKDGEYPFAKTVNEPFANDFFWGNGHPQKYMGEQDLINTFINAMADKTLNALLPTGLSSDLDDLVDDDTIERGKIRKVGDISKWTWWQAPEVNSGEMNMFQTILQLARESAATDSGQSFTPRGGKLQTRQILLQQQEVLTKLSFNMTFLEDLECDRTKLRLSHILQFYSIPKIEKITGKSGKTLEQLLYREVQVNDTKLSDGRIGTKYIKIIGDEHKNPDKRAKLADQLSLKEMMGEMNGTPVEALAISVDSFDDFNNVVQVVKYSSFEKNSAVDQSARMDFANWRFQISQLAPIPNPEGLVKWVEEPFDIDADEFETPNQNAQQAPPQGMMPQQQAGQPPQGIPNQPPQPQGQPQAPPLPQATPNPSTLQQVAGMMQQ